MHQDHLTSLLPEYLTMNEKNKIKGSNSTLIEYLTDDLMVKLRYILNAKYKNDLCLLTGNICNTSQHI